MGFRHDRASAGRSHEPLARGAHGAGPARTVLAGLVAVATLATGGLVASTAYAGGAGDNRPGGATGGLPAGMFWQYKDDASGSFGPAANADGSPRIASVEAAYKRAGVSVVNDGVYDGPGAIRDTLRGALSKCVAGFRQRHPGEGDGDCRVVGVGSVAGQQGGRWVYNGSAAIRRPSGTRPGTRRSNRIHITMPAHKATVPQMALMMIRRTAWTRSRIRTWLRPARRRT